MQGCNGVFVAGVAIGSSQVWEGGVVLGGASGRVGRAKSGGGVVVNDVLVGVHLLGC